MLRNENDETLGHGVTVTQDSEKPLAVNSQPDTPSRPSTFFTKATSVIVDRITPQLLTIEEDTDPEDEARSYTTFSRSADGDIDSSSTIKIPKLNELRVGSKKDVECPFCFRIKRFKNERIWRRHVFSDLRTYVCTFPNCDSPYFGDINDWFRHEMAKHRVLYICQLCRAKDFQTEEHYLAHVRRKHSTILDDGEKETVLEIARKPLGQLKAHDCPCCLDWIDHLRERTTAESGDPVTSSDIIYTAPDVFKRHLASHLEQLALFSIPFPAGSTEEDVKSMVANGDCEDAISARSANSPLAFDSPTSLSTAESSKYGSEILGGLLQRRTSEVRDDASIGAQFGESDQNDQPRNASLVERSEDANMSDPTPYPAFLKYDTSTLNGIWSDLEWTQMNRLRAGMETTDTGAPAQWARCNGDEYAPRNRYMNVDPYQANRVHLKVPEGAFDYINASPITLVSTRKRIQLRYIVTQGPKADSGAHFWRMLWHETTSPAVIIMLTKTYGQGREKCYPYYPRSTSESDLRVNEHDEFGDKIIHNLHLAKLSHDHEARTEFREIDISEATKNDIAPCVSSDSRKVWHLLFEGWPDFSVPEGSDRLALLNLIELSRAKNDMANPQIIHCSAGIGRSGTFIALDWLMQELEEGALDDIPEKQDPIVHIIQTLRDQRPMVVQSKLQFVFIYDTLRERWRER